MSLVVCTCGRPHQVGRLLECLGNESVRVDEVLIIDGSRDDETEQVVRDLRNVVTRLPPNLEYHRVADEHRGLTRQRNYGIARARGAIVAFLDDDALPESGYFGAIAECFARHPAAAGVGGYIVNEVTWRRTGEQRCTRRLSTFCWCGWERREDYRWRVRKLLGLAGSYPPGRMPSFGHGRPIGFLPPDGNDYEVEFFMGGASAWRREMLETHRFSTDFEGYGLYEDLDFCLRLSRHHPLYLCTAARLEHHHAPAGRPRSFRYGVMVVRNGWHVWRQRWPKPAWPDRLRWWAITILLAAGRIVDSIRGPNRLQALSEASGRLWGIGLVLGKAPQPSGR